MLTSTPHPIAAPPAAQARFGPPKDFDEEAGSMTTAAFVATYAPSSGPLRLGHWQCTDPDRPASRLGPQARNYRATISVGDRITTMTAAACGPVGALTAMLHDHGITMEMMRFHQRDTADGTATFIRGSDGVHAEWAMGLSEDATQSALRAVIACANRLQAERD